MRVKTSTLTKLKHKKLLAKAKGYRTGRKHSIKLARQAILKAGSYSYRDRRAKKRFFRSQWIIIINAALSQSQIKYSQFISLLAKANVSLDRKTLSFLAKNQPEIFQAILTKIMN